MEATLIFTNPAHVLLPSLRSTQSTHEHTSLLGWLQSPQIEHVQKRTHNFSFQTWCFFNVPYPSEWPSINLNQNLYMSSLTTSVSYPIPAITITFKVAFESTPFALFPRYHQSWWRLAWSWKIPWLVLSGSPLSPSVHFTLNWRDLLSSQSLLRALQHFKALLWTGESPSCGSLYHSSLAFLCSLILLCALHSFYSISFPPQGFCTLSPFAENSCPLLTYLALHRLCAPSSVAAFTEAVPWPTVCGPLVICLHSSGSLPYVAFFSLQFYIYVVD